MEDLIVEHQTDSEPNSDSSRSRSTTIDRPNTIDSVSDRFHLVKLLFFMIGLSQLLPFNFLTTSEDFWMYKFRSLSNDTVIIIEDKNELQKFFSSYLTIVCCSPYLLIYFVCLTKWFQRISFDLKNGLGFISEIVIFVLITASVFINTDRNQLLYLITLLSMVFIISCWGNIIQSNFTGQASLFPASYMRSMVNGQAISGLFASLAKIASLLSDRSLQFSVFCFFVLADLVLLITLFLYIYSRREPFYRLYSFENVSSSSSNNEPMNFELFIKIFKKLWPFCLTLLMTFWITISLFPALFVLIIPENESDEIVPEKLILPIFCFLIFNLGDFLGRFIGSYMLLTKDSKITLLLISIFRIIFIPIFIYCNAQPRHHLVLFSSEIYFVIFNFIFALLNGYLVLNVFVNAPLTIPEQHRQIAGYLLVSFLGFGLTLGSLTSPLIVDIL
ncbi:Equilibrative nucleoside transporter 3 [Sarcoptes scabiei]|uniref:Equilibrative nucleoside transporter 3 n=1 Tax=Sarcoptes scabiei TaxID=52283 RepID=A0A834VA92_SARSC|nr:Equilibrative nucleoside transporter 3 [Sarcoptes scabiei]